jgi:small subunit ribosomal protein S5
MAKNREVKPENKGSHSSQAPEASGLMEKVLFINRCSKTVKGGKKMSFSALILVGDGNGQVGYGFAKANELTDAIRKGGEIAKKRMIQVPREGTTIPHDIEVKWDGAQLLFRSAPLGTGIIAGSKVRAIMEFAGYKDIMAKSMGSSNPINLVRATFDALQKLTPRKEVVDSRRCEHAA